MTTTMPPLPPPKNTESEESRYDLTPPEQVRLFFRFFRFLTPYKSKVILGILLTLLGTPLGQLSAFLLKNLTDDALLATDKATEERFALLYHLIGLQVILYLLSFTMARVQEIIGMWYLDLRITFFLRRTFYNHLHRLPLAFFRNRPIGEHMYRAVRDTNGGWGGVSEMTTRILPMIFNVIYSLAWAAFFLFLVDKTLALLVLCYMVPYTVGQHWFWTRLKRTKFLQMSRTQNEVSVLRDSLAGLPTLKALGRTRGQARKYVEAVVAARRMDFRWTLQSLAAGEVFLWTLRWIFEKSIWFYAVARVMQGSLTVGDYLVTFTLVANFRRPLEELLKYLQNIRLMLVPAQRILETLDVAPEITDPPQARNLPAAQGEVRFDNVSFEYAPGGRPVLQNVSFVIPAGASAAFVGPSGAGKSTILSLLLRLYDPTVGSVCIDGHDLRFLRLNSFLDQTGVVPQSTFLFEGDIAENIRYGKLDATDEEIAHALEAAELTEFVNALPEGKATYLGEGTRLSGGQKQRIGIARALIRSPRVLILDEATASLDPAAEHAILRTLRRVEAGRTVIAVAHRLRTIAHSDIIFVLDGGRIVDWGRHTELLNRCILYRRMWDEQTEGGLIFTPGSIPPASAPAALASEKVVA